MKCADCKTKECYGGKDCTNIKGQSIDSYNDNPELMKLSEAGSYLEGNYYMQLTRIEEFVVFCHRMGYKKIGIAFCIGFSEEAKMLSDLLSKYFDVHSACCKICGIAKEEFSFAKIDDSRYEASCNPAGQALTMNEAKTDINVILGLCIGHDIAFTKTSEASVTTLAVKDRVLSHNPLGALYSNYYRKRLTDRIEKIAGVKTKD